MTSSLVLNIYYSSEFACQSHRTQYSISAYIIIGCSLSGKPFFHPKRDYINFLYIGIFSMYILIGFYCIYFS